MKIYDRNNERDMKAAKERIQNMPIKEQARLQAISDWIWEYESFVDTQWKDMGKVWKDAYTESFNECMERERKEKEENERKRID